MNYVIYGMLQHASYVIQYAININGTMLYITYSNEVANRLQNFMALDYRSLYLFLPVLFPYESV